VDLPEFVLARVAELECRAQAGGADRIGSAVYRSLDCEVADVLFVHHVDPARVLAWCAALRAVVDDAVYARDHWHDEADGLLVAVKRLAALWAEHPDYDPVEFDPSWR
jgi:uncharacterized protein DUF6221